MNTRSFYLCLGVILALYVERLYSFPNEFQVEGRQDTQENQGASQANQQENKENQQTNQASEQTNQASGQTNQASEQTNQASGQTNQASGQTNQKQNQASQTENQQNKNENQMDNQKTEGNKQEDQKGQSNQEGSEKQGPTSSSEENKEASKQGGGTTFKACKDPFKPYYSRCVALIKMNVTAGNVSAACLSGSVPGEPYKLSSGHVNPNGRGYPELKEAIEHKGYLWVQSSNIMWRIKANNAADGKFELDSESTKHLNEEGYFLCEYPLSLLHIPKDES